MKAFNIDNYLVLEILNLFALYGKKIGRIISKLEFIRRAQRDMIAVSRYGLIIESWKDVEVLSFFAS